MKTKTYIEKVSVPDCTPIHHVWSFDGEAPAIGSLCECGQCRWDDSHLTPLVPDEAAAPKAGKNRLAAKTNHWKAGAK
jgi:hypothetical protein